MCASRERAPLFYSLSLLAHISTPFFSNRDTSLILLSLLALLLYSLFFYSLFLYSHSFYTLLLFTFFSTCNPSLSLFSSRVPSLLSLSLLALLLYFLYALFSTHTPSLLSLSLLTLILYSLFLYSSREGV